MTFSDPIFSRVFFFFFLGGGGGVGGGGSIAIFNRNLQIFQGGRS